MRAALLVLLAACGGQPALANAPHPNNAAVAGGAAAAAAAITLASPDSAKPEKPTEKPKDAIEVKESVPSDVLDRLDHQPATDAPPSPTAKPTKRKGPVPKVPSPHDAAEHEEHARDPQ
jgi:hypothetical protein